MTNAYSEIVYFDYEQQALNFPVDFLKANASKVTLPEINRTATDLLKIKTAIALGDFGSAQAQLMKFDDKKVEQCDDFLKAKYLLHKYNIAMATNQNQKAACEILSKAIQFGKRSNSKLLQCELITTDVLARMSDNELTHSEDMLHEAMLIASESGNLQCVMSVHIAYIFLYHNQNLPDAANREIQMLKELCTIKDYPYIYTLLQNHIGINALMLRNYPAAGESLRHGLEVADEHGYRYLEASLLINGGILDRRRNDAASAVRHHKEAYLILENCQATESLLAEKALDNWSLALSAAGEYTEAIRMHRSSLARATKQKNPDRESMLRVNLADVLIEMNMHEEAKDLLEKAVNHFQETNNYALLQNAWLCMARLYETQEKYQDAFNCMEELYQTTQLHFRQSFNRQSEKLNKRISDLRKEYMLIKSNCKGNASTNNAKSGTCMIGEHPKLKAALNMAIQAAKYPYVNVIISGESGTGKEIIARLIHDNSVSNRSMIAVNASAIPPNLMESELFGHVKGSFTGAIGDHKGKFVLADKSTLFLDEISEMPLELQAKLLRAIETRSISPVGSSKETAVNCRIISATNRKMADLIRANTFRLDLYHRLNKVEIHLPPLRERLSDLEQLCEHFVNRFATEFALPVPKLEDSFFERLRGYHFPGNIRELMNIIERIFILSPKPSWDKSQLDGLVDESPINKLKHGNIQDNMDQTEYQMILHAMQEANWIQKDAAKLLGMTESTLSRHKNRLGIKRQ